MCILLKDEINKLETQEDFNKLLYSTVWATMMSHLIQRGDIQEYFKTILEEVFEQIEKICSNKKMAFILKEIEKHIKVSADNNTFGDNNLDNSTSSFNISLSFLSGKLEDIDFYKRNDNIKEREISKIYNEQMNRDCLVDLMRQKQNDENLYDYLLLQYNKIEDANIYSSKKFKEKASYIELGNKIMESYQSNYIKIIAFLGQILDKLLDNFHYLPYSTKCISKILKKISENIKSRRKCIYFPIFFL
jgi:hypothetical protein